MNWRRTTARITIFLVLGAIINVAVAWACVLFPFGPGGAGPIEHTEEDLQWWRTHAPPSWSDKFGFKGIGARRGELWWVLSSDPSLEEGFVEYAQVKAGLPLKSMTGQGWVIRTYDVSNGSFQEHIQRDLAGVWRFESAPDQYGSTLETWIPLHPIWPGSLANSILYGSALWFVCFSILALRRCWRMQAGHCPNCNYDLHANTTGTCPECGTALPNRSRS